MSWFRDPELFVDFLVGEPRLWRLTKKSGTPFAAGDFTFIGNVSHANYLSLVDHSFAWKKSDYNAFADFIYRNDLVVNCQGLVITVAFPRDRNNGYRPDGNRPTYFWSHEVLNMPKYGLPVPSIPSRPVRYIGGGELTPIHVSETDPMPMPIPRS
ncbi:hypothetical protein MKW98_013716 [Papaver atlanticum]|uniref:Uncharacterized protein n=1 Tax=Papaver atlanticum TaxID=357466 RepID=A0AAD4SGF2_9MAGN|nr:hypothetical protein MKW98_013716 [Papaver atlanticum]